MCSPFAPVVANLSTEVIEESGKDPNYFLKRTCGRQLCLNFPYHRVKVN